MIDITKDKESYYKDYNVLDSIKEWDAHTKEIVIKRLGPFPPLEFLNDNEVKKMRIIIKHLVYDNREDIVDWVVNYVDQRLHSRIGENQRKPKTPAEHDLLRGGLLALDNLAKTCYQKDFISIEVKEQFDLLASVQVKQAAIIPDWDTIPQKDLFNKLLELIIPAYYSHPTVWSEIGYGGPAYPRGYYRIELGWTDPWEPKSTKEQTMGT